MRKKIGMFVTLAVLSAANATETAACTGITLRTKDSTQVVARTIEWGGSDLNSQYVIVPRGYRQQSLIAGGKPEGLVFTARYGYVGLAVEQKEFVAEGLNEEGLSAGLFYFPGYGKYEEYDEKVKDRSLSDLQLVSWILGSFKSVDEVKNGMGEVHVIGVDPRASTAHWRIADAEGKQMVIEIVDGKVKFYDNPLGVITNSPGFDWQLTNLNNYVNLQPGGAQPHTMGNLTLRQFGAGGAMLGLPGDITPPSRFVRAAFYQTATRVQPTALKTVEQCFRILNNFDIPLGIEFAAEENIVDIPGATQWTSATDIANRRIYYRTMYNSRIRCIDLNEIDFSEVKYRDEPLDKVKEERIETVRIH